MSVATRLSGASAGADPCRGGVLAALGAEAADAARVLVGLDGFEVTGAVERGEGVLEPTTRPRRIIGALAVILDGSPVPAPASLAGLEASRRPGLLERVGSDGLGAGPVHGHVGAVAGELGEIDEAGPVAGR